MTPRKKTDDTAEAPKPKRARAKKAAPVETPAAIDAPEQVQDEAVPAKTLPVEVAQVEPVPVDASPEPESPVAGDADLPEELPAVAGTAPQIDQMVAFHLGDQRYALPIGSVQEIQQIVAVAEAPATSQAVIGMVNLRGHVIPAIDLRTLIGMPREEYKLDTPMIISRADDHLVALVVDEVEDVIDLPVGSLTPPPKLHSLSEKMIGVVHLDTELVFLLSVERLVAPLGLGSVGGW